MNAPLHLTDEELQSLADGAALRAEANAHLSGCAACQAGVASYRQLAGTLARLDRLEPPLDFTAAILSQLPPAAPRLVADDLAAVVIATGAALAAAVLFRQSDGASLLFQTFHRLPGRALSEAFVAATLHANGQVSVLIALSVAALVLGAPLWRLLSPNRTAA